MYSTADDLKNLLPEAELLQLADDSGEASGLEDEDVQAVLIEAIDQADREIDAFAGLVQSVPLDPVPGLAANLSARIAIHNLYVRRSTVPEDWQRDYERCQKLLEMIGRGNLKLGPAPGGTSTPSGGVRYTGAAKKFGDLGDLW